MLCRTLSPPSFQRPKVDTERSSEYAKLLAINLATLTKGNSSTEIAHQLFSNCIEAAFFLTQQAPI
jgi:hypothetical protein